MRLPLLLVLTLPLAAFSCAQNTPVASGDPLVFSTHAKWSPDQVVYNGSTYNVQVTKDCKGEVGAADACIWRIDFGSDALPYMRCDAEPMGFTTEDLNRDGTQEIIVLCNGGGAWLTLHVFTWGASPSSSGPYWEEPIGSFDWWAGLQGEPVCDARIFWMEDTHSVKVLTTEAGEGNYKCTKELVMEWVVQ